jgi:hypothetical protein
MCGELITKIGLQSKARTEGQLHFALLPKLYLPLVVPVCREMKFSPVAGFSLPPYVSEGAKDSGLAILLARYGDTEAARKLIDATDRSTVELIDAAAFERAYPVEWTRLVGLLMHEAQLQLATGDIQGGTDVVAMHKQLREILDAKAAQGPLGAILLGLGHETLKQAEAAWRQEKLEIADQAAAILKEWGPIPNPVTAVPVGQGSTWLTKLVPAAGHGRTLAAASVSRALDLFELPLPEDGANAAWMCFGSNDELEDVYITYQPSIKNQLPAPRDLAWNLEGKPEAAREGARQPGLSTWLYDLGKATCAVTTVDHGAGLGAMVRIGSGKEPATGVALARDFGALHLDRSFEQNRVRVLPEQRAGNLSITQPERLAQIVNPVPALKLGEVEVQEENGHDLVNRIGLEFPCREDSIPPLCQYALPLWETLGAPKLVGRDDAHGGHLALVWKDRLTEYRLCLPYEGGQPIRLDVADARGPQSFSGREARAASFGVTERKQRLQSGKPLQILKRQLDQYELGMTRGPVMATLPGGAGVLTQDFANGLTVTFTGEAASSDRTVTRQIFLVFDRTNRLSQIRIRYVDGPAAGNKAAWAAAILAGLTKINGAPTEGTSTWTGLWKDTGRSKVTPQSYLWNDDTTVLMYQCDRDGVEVALFDYSDPGASPNGTMRLSYLPAGPENCLLGTTRQDLLRNWKVDKPVVTEDGAMLLQPPSSSLYDALLVWFDGDRVARVVARQAREEERSNPDQWSRALHEVWSREGSVYGWPRRVDMAPHNNLQGLGWHDDEKQIYVFWREANDGTAHIYREWRQLTP